MARVVTYNADAVIYIEGEINRFIYIIKEGEALLSHEEININKRVETSLSVGDLFGVKSALLKHPSLETVKAITVAKFLVIEGDEFLKYPSSYKEISYVILNNIIQQLHKIKDDIYSEQKNITAKNQQHGMVQLLNYYMFSEQFEKARYVHQKYTAAFPNGDYSQLMEDYESYIDKKRLPGKLYNEIKQNIGSQYFGNDLSASGSVAASAVKLKKALALKAAKEYHQAISLINSFINHETNEQRKTTARFELCGCYLLDNSFEKCLDNLLLLIQESPDFAEKNSLVKMAKLCYANTKNIDKTDEFLRRLMSAGADDATMTEAGNQLLYMAKVRV